MRKIFGILIALYIVLPLWSQTMEVDVLDINLLHQLRKNIDDVDSIVVADFTLMDSVLTEESFPLDTLFFANDTISISVENRDTIIVLDSLLDSVDSIAQDVDAILLELVARQSKLLHAKDTIWEKYPHPLCM